MPGGPRPRSESAPLLRAIGIRRVAVDSKVLLDDLSLELNDGDRVALVGPSGAGKSLLLRALVLLDPVDQGRLEWRGAEILPHEVPGFRRRAVFVAQNPMVDEGSVEEQLERPWRFASAGGADFDRQRAIDLLRSAGRDAGFLELRGSNLSGGEAQLMALVRALLLEPRVLLLDEPTAAMDGRTRAAVEALLEAWLAADSRRAWVWVSHDPRQLARTCGREIRLEHGRCVP